MTPGRPHKHGGQPNMRGGNVPKQQCEMHISCTSLFPPFASNEYGVFLTRRKLWRICFISNFITQKREGAEMLPNVAVAKNRGGVRSAKKKNDFAQNSNSGGVPRVLLSVFSNGDSWASVWIG